MLPMRVRAVLALGFVGLALQASAASPERAVNAAAFLGPVPLVYGDHTINAALANPLEVDSFTFQGVAGDSLLIQLRGLTGGIDPSVTLRGPGGTEVGVASCVGVFGSGPCSLTLARTLAISGTYTINMADTNADDQGSYQLHLERYPPVFNWVGIGYGSPATADALGHPVDIDHFAFNGVAGTGVRVTVSSPATIDPHMEIWDPAGTKVYSSFCTGVFGTGPCSNSHDLSINQSGLYRVAIFDAVLDETGNYNLQVSCLFGNCPLPTAPVPAVPEPAAWLMLPLGLLFLLSRRASRDRAR